MQSMRIGIVGSGEVGRALGRGWGRHGHEVTLGSGHPERDELQEWQRETGQRVADFEEAAVSGELVALALRGSAVLEVLGRLGQEPFAGKVVVDATNPLRFDRGGPELYVGHVDSLGEQVQGALPDARVVKAYNTVGNALMVDPDLAGGPPTMFLAGNDEDAKATVVELLSATGWDAADLGDITAARELEAMCLAWVKYGARTGTWGHAFRLLR